MLIARVALIHTYHAPKWRYHLKNMYTFAEYDTARSELGRRCDALVEVWRDAQIRSQIELIAREQQPHDSGGPISQLLNEARQRLAGDTVEIGVFGQVKRGKSTLINALVGVEVSPMRMVPETATPIWIEHGRRPQSRVLLADGQVVDDLSMEEAKLMSSQRHRARTSEGRPIRVEHRLPIEWLPIGVRLIDTPGLDDPALAEAYERLTLAELDRVAASIIVLVSPPGPAGEEVRLLKSLGTRSIDKVFIVCNFWPDQWSDSETVDEMKTHIERIVLEGAGDRISAEDIGVYPISAKDGLAARHSIDEEAFEESGIGRLRRDIETYLSRGVLERMVGFVERRIGQAANLVTDVLVERRRILSTPGLNVPARDALERELRNSQSVISQLNTEMEKTATSLTASVREVVSEPFTRAIHSVGSATKRSELTRVTEALRIGFEAAASQAATLVGQRAGVEQARAQRVLYDSFGIEDRLRSTSSITNRLNDISDVMVLLPVARPDRDATLAGGVAGATAGGILGGTVLGGAGLALLAAGPVGWLIGLGIGALMGGGIAATATRIGTRDSLSTDDRQTLIADLKEHERSALRKASEAVSDWAETAKGDLEHMRRTYFEAKREELHRINTVLSNSTARESEIRRIDDLLARVKALAGQQD